MLSESVSRTRREPLENWRSWLLRRLRCAEHSSPQQQPVLTVACPLQLQRNITDLEETMRGIFSSVFVHRYRDVRPEIRAVCISELGAWMLNYRWGVFNYREATVTV